ncbi:MAG: type II secretion system protein GspE, partial [Planctomycetota bacterium]
IYELLVMDEQLREMAFNRATTHELREVAKSKGMFTLLEDGVRKILDGLTSIPEVLNVAKREDVTY